MKLMVDGVVFQRARSGIARVWATVLPLLVERGIEVTLLDRGGCPTLPGVRAMPFPTHRMRDTAADALLIQQVCDTFRAELFTSTYYTSAIDTPSVMLVHDMIPELLEFDLTERNWIEKELAIIHATALVAVSHSTARDLLRFYPELDPERVTVAHNGIHHEIFRPRGLDEVAVFLDDQGLRRRYFILAGSREQHSNHKNGQLFFDALRDWPEQDVDVLCVGGEPTLEPATTAKLPTGIRALRVTLTDDELACAYAGAAALIYPSLHEGFGLPVVEAMACGCPVITMWAASLPEVAGDAALIVSGRSAGEMRERLTEVLRPDVRQRLQAKGLKQAERFQWNAAADIYATVMRRALDTARTPRELAFRQKWARLRREQARVDFLT